MFEAELDGGGEDVGGVDVGEVRLEVVGVGDLVVDEPAEVVEVDAVEVVEGADVVECEELRVEECVAMGVDAVGEDPGEWCEEVEVSAGGGVSVVVAGGREFVAAADVAGSGVQPSAVSIR